MPLRLPYETVIPTPGSVLHSYWGPSGFHRPVFDAFAVGPGNRIDCFRAMIDSGSDYVVLASQVAMNLGLAPPFTRLAGISAAGGAAATTVSFPPDGLVSLFVTDYREYAYLPSPLVGFHPPALGTTKQRSVLGLTGFLQFFRQVHEPQLKPPIAELDPLPGFPGLAGLLPRDRSLYDFIRSLRISP
jgi:hypothetical protein